MPPDSLGFGLFDWTETRPGVSPAEVFDHRLALLAEADRGGFDVYHVAEHHATPLGMAPSPAVFTAAAAMASTRIRLAPTTFILPLYDPLRLVQEIAMLDQLSRGRLEIGVGKGSSPHEVALFGLTPAQGAARFDELLPAIVEALETGLFRRPGAAGPAGEPVELHVGVHQRPHPPLWYPTSNPGSIPRLGDQGFDVLFGASSRSPSNEVVRVHSRVFRAHVRAGQERGGGRYALPGRTPRFGLNRQVYVAPTDAEALAVARRAFPVHFASLTHLWRLHDPDRFRAEVDVDALAAEHKLFVGSPATVADQLAEAVTVGEVDYFAGAFAWGDLDLEESLRSMRLFRDEVVPSVRRRVGSGLTAAR